MTVRVVVTVVTTYFLLLQMSILTSFYQNVVYREPLECASEPEFNYTPYSLFCLETRLIPLLKKLVSPTVFVNFDTERRDSRIYQLVKIYTQDSEGRSSLAKLTDTQLDIIRVQVDYITTIDRDYCILITGDDLVVSDSGEPLPPSWVKTILPYLPLDNIVYPFYKNDAIYVNLNARSEPYRALSPDYTETYTTLTSYVRQTLNSYYRSGYVVSYCVAEEVTGQLELQPLSDDGYLYAPSWIDHRFAPNPVEFILNRLRGETEVRVKIGNNQVKRHLVSQAFNQLDVDYLFSGPYLIFQADSLQQIRTWTSAAANAAGLAQGKVITLSVPDEEQLNRYRDTLEGFNFTIYRSLDSVLPVVVSVMVTPEVETQSGLEELRSLVYRSL